MDGPGQLHITRANAKFIDASMLDRFVHEMVKRSPLQGSRVEVILSNEEIGIIVVADSVERATSA